MATRTLRVPVAGSAQRALVDKDNGVAAFVVSGMVKKFSGPVPRVTDVRTVRARRNRVMCSSSVRPGVPSLRVEEAASVLRDAEYTYSRAKKAYKAADAAYKAAIAVQSAESSPIESSTGTTESELRTLEATYRLAKAAYKAVERDTDFVEGVHSPDALALKEDYRVKKAAYKAAKAAFKSKSKVVGPPANVDESTVANEHNGKQARPNWDQIGADSDDMAFWNTHFKEKKRGKDEGKELRKMVKSDEPIAKAPFQGTLVCGGKSCTRLGAAAVAEMLLGPRMVPNAKCMKACGGVGPSVSLAGQVVKVDIRGATANAVANAKQSIESPSLTTPNVSV